jgi:hypothetical protein
MTASEVALDPLLAPPQRAPYAPGPIICPAEEPTRRKPVILPRDEASGGALSGLASPNPMCHLRARTSANRPWSYWVEVTA